MSIRTALENRLERLKNNDKGFTLIELLVVVIIIGILAAIAIPVFLGQQNAARDSAAQSNLATAKVAYVSALVSSDTPTEAKLADFGWPAGKVEVVTSGQDFCLQTTEGNGGAEDAVWSVRATADEPAKGACTVVP